MTDTGATQLLNTWLFEVGRHGRNGSANSLVQYLTEAGYTVIKASELDKARYVAETFKQCLTDTYRPHVEENKMLRDVTIFNQDSIEQLEATIARVKALAEELKDSDDRTWISNIGETISGALEGSE